MLLQGTVADGVISGFNKGGVLVDLQDLKGEQQPGSSSSSSGCIVPWCLILTSRMNCGRLV